MTYSPPCNRPEKNPDDWFLSKDGKQYPDEDFLTDAEVRGLAASVLRIEGETYEEHQARVDRALRAARADRRRKALRRRRDAKAACQTCYFRTDCLDKAIDEQIPHGTWGGYYEEELRELREAIEQRRNA